MEPLAIDTATIRQHVAAKEHRWREMRRASPGTTCQYYFDSCAAVITVAARTEYGYMSCPCVDEKRAELERAQAADTLLRRLSHFGPPPSNYKQMTFEAYRPASWWRQHQSAAAMGAKKACVAYAKNPHRKPFLVLFGSPGVGKSHLAMAIAQSAGLIPVWANMPQFFRHLRRSFDDAVDADFHEEIAIALNAALLVIDDLGAERLTEWVEEQLYDVINERYQRAAPTVITTNEDVLQMTGRLGSRIRDRAKSQLVRMDDMPDFRIGAR